MEKMEKYLEKKKNEKNDTFEQILEKDREDVSKECERDAKKKQKKYNFDELKKIGLDLTPYKEDYPEFFKKIIELFIKLKNEEQKNIYSGLKSNLELNQDIILNSSCFSEIKEAYENLKDEISIDYTNYYRMLNLNSTLPILSYERRNMQHLIEEFKKIREFKIPLREDVSSINEALKIFDEKQKIQIFNFIYGILIEKKVEDFEKYKEKWFEIICDEMNFRNQYKENFYMIASKIWKYNSIKIRKKILQMVISFEEIDDEVGGQIQCRVDEHDAAHHDHSLIVAEQGGEHLLYGGGLHLTGGGFFHGNAAHQLCHCKNYRYDQRHPAEASALAVAAECSYQQHGEHGNEGRTNARTGTPYHGEVLPVFWGAGHGGDHGPVGDIHHGIGDTPEDIKYRRIGHKSAAGQRGRRCKHQKQNHCI